ncbi:MAG: hypothetical protein PHG83_01400 [Patescibacteria group bacterium]|nr:hypothetical protein [Patescibacteria group bacterium]
MKIAICGSIAFSKEILETQKILEAKGFVVIVPKDILKYAEGEVSHEDKWAKIEGDVFKEYFEEIKKCDAVLVINKDKNNIENYIGGNSLIEMAFAHILNKKIFLLNPIPKINYTDEIEAMKPIILNGDLDKI